MSEDAGLLEVGDDGAEAVGAFGVPGEVVFEVEGVVDVADGALTGDSRVGHGGGYGNRALSGGARIEARCVPSPPVPSSRARARGDLVPQ